MPRITPKLLRLPDSHCSSLDIPISASSSHGVGLLAGSIVNSCTDSVGSGKCKYSHRAEPEPGDLPCGSDPILRLWCCSSNEPSRRLCRVQDVKRYFEWFTPACASGRSFTTFFWRASSSAGREVIPWAGRFGVLLVTDPSWATFSGSVRWRTERRGILRGLRFVPVSAPSMCS